MHIFLTNDDGFEAPGIRAMALVLAKLGRVTVIAPSRGRSSCSSSLTLQQYLRLWHKDSYGDNITVLACSGTTADCCKLALEYWLRDDKPDLIVSGVNNGFNTGSDCLYSGTVAGAMEGSFFGIPAIAVSAETAKKPEFLRRVADFAGDVVRKYFVDNHFEGILNLNVPEKASVTWDELKVVKLGLQHYDSVIRELKDPSGHLGFWLSGKPIESDSPEEDVYWAHRGKITLTPIQWDQSDLAKLDFAQEVAAKAVDGIHQNMIK